ncbi:MAG TPA: DUF167 domain-containing protein [Candidatus Binatia bacterium]
MSSPELDARQVGDGVRIKLRVVPGAKRDAILGLHGDALRISVRAAPEKGRANEAVERLLAQALDVQPSSVELVRGTSGRDKIVHVRGIDLATVRQRLGAAQSAADR